MQLSLDDPKTKVMLKRVWTLSWPVILTNLLQSLVNVVDVFMVGRLGPIAIAAIGMATAINFLVLVMVLAVAAGAMSLIAQAKGARDPERMSFVTRQAITSGLMLSACLTLIGYLLTQPLLTWANSGGEPEAVTLGAQYLRIIFLGMPFLVLNVVFNRLMQGAGDTKTPLYLTATLNLLNILFNYLLIFGAGPIPALGLRGAAIGTVAARGVGVAIVLVIIYSGRNVVKILAGTYRPHWRLIGDIFSIGVPSGLQGVFRNGSRLLVISIVTSTEVGTYGAAALGIGIQLESLAFMPVLGLNVAATSLVGQALGSWQTVEARQRGNMAMAIGVVIMILLATPIVIFAPQIIQLFDPSAHPVLAQAGTAYLRINTLTLPMTAVAMVANGALRGAGDTFPGMLSTMLNRGLISVGLAYLFAFPLGYGSTGVWVALAIGTVFEGVYMWLRWRGSTWYRIALHKTDVYRQHLRHLPESMQQTYLAEVRTPLMAEPTAREHVTADQVLYMLPDRDIEVRFHKSGYQVV